MLSHSACTTPRCELYFSCLCHTVEGKDCVSICMLKTALMNMVLCHWARQRKERRKQGRASREPNCNLICNDANALQAGHHTVSFAVGSCNAWSHYLNGRTVSLHNTAETPRSKPQASIRKLYAQVGPPVPRRKGGTEGRRQSMDLKLLCPQLRPRSQSGREHLHTHTH